MKRLLVVAAGVAVALAIAMPAATTASAVDAGDSLCALGPRSADTAGGDLLIGTSGDDVLTADLGDDTILGCGGNDHLSGGRGNDLLMGGTGDDVIDGGVGDDIADAEYRTYDRYFPSGLPIPCCGSSNRLEIPITISAQEIRNIHVRLDIEHASPADLRIELLTPVSPFQGGDVLLTARNCSRASSTGCGPGQFHNPSSVETGVTFTSDTSVNISGSGPKKRNLNGMFHPHATLDLPFRFQPSCGSVPAPCQYVIRITDSTNNGIDGVVRYAGIDLLAPGSRDGADIIIGGEGIGDLANYVDRDGGISYTGQDGLANDGESGEGDDVRDDVEWFYGGAGNDTLTGTDNLNGGFNDLRGMYGRDTVNGLGGNDWLDKHASWGTDRLDGGTGNDVIDGGVEKAVDFIDGGPDQDRCRNGKVVRNCEIVI